MAAPAKSGGEKAPFLAWVSCAQSALLQAARQAEADSEVDKFMRSLSGILLATGTHVCPSASATCKLP